MCVGEHGEGGDVLSTRREARGVESTLKRRRPRKIFWRGNPTWTQGIPLQSWGAEAGVGENRPHILSELPPQAAQADGLSPMLWGEGGGAVFHGRSVCCYASTTFALT